MEDEAADLLLPANESLEEFFKIDCIDLREVLSSGNDDLTMEPTVKLIIIIVYSVLVITSVLTNTVVLLAAVRYQHHPRSTVHCRMVATLALLDMVLIVTSGIVTPVNVVNKNWLFGAFMCKAIPFVQGFTCFACAYVLTALAIDCYWTVCKPHEAISTRRWLAVMMPTALIALAMATVPAVFQENTRFAGMCGDFCIESWPSKQVQVVYGSTALLIQFWCPLGLIAYCHVATRSRINQLIKFRGSHILSVVTVRDPSFVHAQARRALQRQHHPATPSELDRLARRNRLLLVMVCAFAICWGPQITLTLAHDTGLFDLYQNQGYLVVLVIHGLAMCSTITNPVLYGYCNTHVQMNVWKMLRISTTSNTTTTKVMIETMSRGQRTDSGIRLPAVSVSNAVQDPSSKHEHFV